jgi:hypothetical protein
MNSDEELKSGNGWEEFYSPSGEYYGYKQKRSHDAMFVTP